MRLAVGLLLATLSWFPAAARAQARDAFVLPAGTVRLSGAGEYSGFEEVFGGSARRPLGLGEALVPESFVPLRQLQGGITTFLAGTANRPGAAPITIGPEALSLGTPDVSVFVSRVHVPLRLAVGVAPRIEIGLGLPLVRGRQLVQRLGVSGATVGSNPDPARNGRLLGRLGANGAALGASALLPTAGSPIGQELQRRVRAATGESLLLPIADSVRAGPILDRYLNEQYGLDSLRARAGAWRVGDAELEIRLRVLDSTGGRAYPTDSVGVTRRVAAFASIRLPTGAPADSASLFPTEADLGIPGFGAGAVGDLFVGHRWWVTGGVRYLSLQPTGVLRRLVPVDRPLSSAEPAVPVDWNPADTLELRIAPRYRLLDQIAVGAEYTLAWLGESTFRGGAAGTDASVLNTPGGMMQSVGLGLHFTSLPGVAAGLTRLPLEVQLTYRRTLTGPPGVPAATGMEVSGSIFASLWGRGLAR